MVMRRPTSRRIALAGLLVALAINTRVPAGLGRRAGAAGPGRARGGDRAGRCAPTGGRDRRRAGGSRLSALGSSAVGERGQVRPAVRHPAGQAGVLRPSTPTARRTGRQRRQPVRARVRADDPAPGGPPGRGRHHPLASRTSGLPRDRPALVGDARFDTLERSLSAPTSMPLLVLLALVGLVAAARAPAAAAAAGPGRPASAGRRRPEPDHRLRDHPLPGRLRPVPAAGRADRRVQALLPALAGRGRARVGRAGAAGAAALVLAGIVVNGPVAAGHPAPAQRRDRRGRPRRVRADAGSRRRPAGPPPAPAWARGAALPAGTGGPGRPVRAGRLRRPVRGRAVRMGAGGAHAALGRAPAARARPRDGRRAAERWPRWARAADRVRVVAGPGTERHRAHARGRDGRGRRQALAAGARGRRRG